MLIAEFLYRSKSITNILYENKAMKREFKSEKGVPTASIVLRHHQGRVVVGKVFCWIETTLLKFTNEKKLDYVMDDLGLESCKIGVFFTLIFY